MPGATEEVKTEAAATPPVFDADAFKATLLQENKAMLDDIANTIVSNVDSRLAGFNAANTKVDAPRHDDGDDDLNPYKDRLGLDDDQVKGLAEFIDRRLEKRGPGFEKKIMTQVDSNLELHEAKKELTRQTAQTYPDVLNKNSPLYRTSVAIYKEMSKEARSGADAEAIAVERAAARLGIRPTTIEDIKARQAGNDTGSGSGGDAKTKDAEIDADFAKFFNVDVKKANEKYKVIQGKKR